MAINSVETIEHGKAAGPCIMVIFGAGGDLTSRKLIPSLFNLAKDGLLAKNFTVLGFSRDTDITEDSFRKTATRFLSDEDRGSDAYEWFAGRLNYMSGDLRTLADYQKLSTRLAELDKANNTGGNYFFYFATAPAFFGDIVDLLGQSGLSNETNGCYRRVIIEKPFGTDLASARALNIRIQKVLDEKQIYRIDHYLGKETVQNLMVFRFANAIYEPIWNRRYIDNIQITVSETVGVEQRGGYFETAGTLRDMVPNHIMQLISLTAMEPPISFQPDAVRDEQAKVLHAIAPMTGEEVLHRTVRGQYNEGAMDGQHVHAYRAEPGVNPQSNTETYVAMKLIIDNWRWAGVPFYLRTGKRMAKRHTEIAITFRKPPFVLFRGTNVDKLSENKLIIKIQPEEGTRMRFNAKVPGPVLNIGAVDMDFDYKDYFGARPATGYEVLLYDCMIGDATLFQRADMVDGGWSIVDPILDVWKALPARSFPNYASGSWGPKEADDLLARDGRRWRDISE